MKLMKNLKNLFCIPAISLVCSTIGIVGSCSVKKGAEEIVLISDVKCLMPSQSTIIKAIVNPSKIRQVEGIQWEVLECPFEGVTIDENGLLSVASSVQVTNATKIAIKATMKDLPEVFNFMYLYIVPYSDSPFSGFANNEIRCLDREGQPTSVHIIQTSEFEYTNDIAIDLFQMDTRPRPEGFTSPIQFIPLITGDSSQYMRFHLDGPTNPDHAIDWEEYTDNNWTNTIPDFRVYDCTLLFDSIKVYFDCDPRICLTINFNTWQPPTEVNQGIITYSPEEGDPHSIDLVTPGTYSSFLYCPVEGTSGVHMGCLKSIYCSYGKYEMPNFNFTFNLAPNLDPEIKQCLKFGADIQEVEREFDHYKIYKIDFYYQFDLNKRIHTADYWDFANFKLLTMRVSDKEFGGLVCLCDFYIDWI